MSKTQKELAFLQDLFISKDWTERFTTFVDTHIKLPKKGKVLYINASTGNHALELREKLHKNVELICVSENKHIQIIAEDKVKAMRSNIQFQKLDELQSESFEMVLADLSFVRPKDINNLLDEIAYVTKKKGNIAFFLPSAGSFGDIFSFLWETFIEVELVEHSGEIERLITEIPTVSNLEEAAESIGLKDVESQTSIEIFEYDSGADFIKSSLIEDYFLPVWLDFLNDKERKKAAKKLSQIIDKEHHKLTFRFSVKATLVSGIKG